MSNNRNLSIDFLRGLAIIGMVLAAVIPWTNDFPGWMFHAQVGPPDFKFNPNNPGITWVDLVFPFFLFAMGAAFPLALRSKLDRGEYAVILQGLLRRGVLLVFFAIILANLNPENLSSSSTFNYLTGIATFGAFFLVFMRFEGTALRRYGLQLLGFLIIGALIYFQYEYQGSSLSYQKNNIILLVLANMAVFGSICWLLTANSHLLRLAIIVAFIGVWFTRDIEGSWTSELWNFHPDIKWFYNFSFLKYLCIVLPGSILGDLLLKNKVIVQESYKDKEKSQAITIAVIGLAFVIFHVVTLYLRELNINLIGQGLFGVLFFLALNKYRDGQGSFYRTLIAWGYVLTCVALCFEPMDGGIKKDPSSFSYWFLTSGLAFIFYVVCDYLTRTFKTNIVVLAIVRNGQNPMVAYCVTAFFITPVLGLLHVLPLLNDLVARDAYLGLIKTVVLIGSMIVITNYTTIKKWFWRS
ncbi:DUF5009 domain-containing protein [Sphingobacterium bovistauri]|uniref:DUF5009 domain-containing protein n=1 Tax=Sphingobacterium bovistauri TaxID=2781959 RepID=A0ABS7Z2I3_9SPHI|nr:DUF5009 domain-containing protein [Sphingobacterium bovistauri]MCA5004384.1 DUF5009 domain-containing protein [Sphingobacterium bovistauri]